jgi:hypothetical protein
MKNSKHGLYMALLMEGLGTEKAERLVNKVYATDKVRILHPERANALLMQLASRAKPMAMQAIARTMAKRTGQAWDKARVLARLRRLARQGRFAAVLVGRYVYGAAR